MSSSSYKIENGQLTTIINKPEIADALVVYDVFRIENGKPLFLTDHLTRIYDGIYKTGHELSVDVQQLSQQIDQLIKASKILNGNIKIECTFSQQNKKECHYALCFIPHNYPTPEMLQKGVVCATLNQNRTNPSIKIANTPVRLQSNKIIEERGVFETILSDGHVITEGSRSNIFFIRDKCIITAPDAMVLQGIIRKKVLETASRLKIPVKLEALTISDLSKVDAAFLTGTSLRILPINRIDDHNFMVTHPIITRLTDAFYELIDR